MSETGGTEPRIYSVSEVLAGLRMLLEERVGRVWVVGELSNLHRARSGHLYFTLKDDAGQVRAALFRNAARSLAFEPEDGLEVLVYGDLSVYEARGDLQLIVRQLEPRGLGALQLAFEQLRARLESEGLFDPERKRPLPARPSRIGVVTSPTGAAIRDVLEVTGRRYSAASILIAATRVQGVGAEDEIAVAIDALSAQPEVDLILLVRGGGSLEDLQAFNSEVVARAIVRATVPVISGVGHEVDVTIADLAADARAATPSVAAEMAVPDAADLQRHLVRDWRRLLLAVRAIFERGAQDFARERDALQMLAPSVRLAVQRARFGAAVRGLVRVGAASAQRGRSRLAELAGRLDSLSPLGVLDRGYALVRRSSDGAIPRTADDLERGGRLAIRLAEAQLEAVVESIAALPRSEKPL
ncbi:MAG: exodeoxyribonuclease VII large subunit [Deltaproteobacteria bacterium]|nr:exodeoxyribonuclease VII large subunit [Deltaproteobacteria bacterium]